MREQIGEVGNADGKYLCHLHFELREENCPMWNQAGAGYSAPKIKAGSTLRILLTNTATIRVDKIAETCNFYFRFIETRQKLNKHVLQP